MDPQEKLTLKSVVKIESEGRWRFVSIKNERRLISFLIHNKLIRSNLNTS